MMKLRDWRKANQYTQKEAAAAFGVTPAYLSMLETGAKVPSIPLASTIDKVTEGQVTANDFYKH